MSARGERRRVVVAAFGDPGHAFPAIALGRAISDRGHTVLIETWEKWRGAVEEVGLGFSAAEGYKVFPPPAPDSPDGAAAADAARALAPLFEDFRPDALVCDILTVAPALAADVAGVRRATLIPHLYPSHEMDMPFFAFGLQPPRTPIGRAIWRAGQPILEAGLRQGRDELNVQRSRLGLTPEMQLHNGLSRDLTLVATFPQLEYPRKWPVGTTITGPMPFELPFEQVGLPGGDAPLVLIAPSTSQDPDNRLVRVALEALAEEPVRVVATTNRIIPSRPIAVPGNAVLLEWVSYSQVIPEAALVVCHGGHGTVARSLASGVPVLLSPAVGDMNETAARVTWSGVGAAVPWRLCRPETIRWAARKVLRDPGFASRAREIAAWDADNDGAARGAELVEAFAQG